MTARLRHLHLTHMHTWRKHALLRVLMSMRPTLSVLETPSVRLIILKQLLGICKQPVLALIHFTGQN